MAYGFDVVSIRIEDKRSVIVRVVMRARTWSAVVLSPRRNGGGMEGVNL
jgi:hypothetical protein